MPELPEVETTVRQLAKQATGAIITGFWYDKKKTINLRLKTNWSAIARAVTGQKILSFTRRAKYILMRLKSETIIAIHQKIAGHLLYGTWPDATKRHIRLVFQLKNRRAILLSDPRRFARIILVKPGDFAKTPELSQLGPEPLELTKKDFLALFSAKRGRIKQVLMNPKFIVGIGNIYADEILWRTGIHPLTEVQKLSPAELSQLYQNTHRILKTAIEQGGSSTGDYRQPSGAKGGFQDRHMAYQKTGQPCHRKDGGVMARIVVGGRSTHFCPVHQIKK